MKLRRAPCPLEKRPDIVGRMTVMPAPARTPAAACEAGPRRYDRGRTRGVSSARPYQGEAHECDPGPAQGAADNPEGIATVDGDRRRSWRDIGERVARLAAGLQQLGTGRGDRVAVLMLNSDRYLELYLGIAWAGAVIVPTNIRWSRAEIEDSLHDCRASSGRRQGLCRDGGRTGQSHPAEADLCR